MGRFNIGDRVKRFAETGAIIEEKSGGYVVKFDNRSESIFVYASELTPEPLDFRYGDTPEVPVELPSKDPYSTGGDEFTPELKALIRERIRYHEMRVERDDLLEFLVQLSGILDYDNESNFSCGNECESCKWELIEASYIVREALENRQKADQPEEPQNSKETDRTEG